MNFRITDLLNFKEVATSRTMREAAIKLEITPPALSESISRLEIDLGGKLFYRSRSGVTLTPFGRRLFEKSKIAIKTLQEIDNFKSGQPESVSGQVTIGCHPLVGAYFLPRALSDLKKLSPGFQLHLKHGLSREIQTEIQQGKIDVGIVVNAVQSPDLVMRKITTDKVAVWSAKESEKNKVFCNLNLNQTQSILNKWTEAPTNRVDSDSIELIARLTQQGFGYGILPERTVQLIAPELVQIKNTPIFNDILYLVHRPEFGRSEFERSVLNCLKASAK